MLMNQEVVVSLQLVAPRTKHGECEVVSSSGEALELTSEPPSDHDSLSGLSEEEYYLENNDAVWNAEKPQREEHGKPRGMDASGNQREQDDSEVSSCCSSLLVEASDERAIETEKEESLSLSCGSTNSDSVAAAVELVVYSSDSDASERNDASEDGDDDAKDRVLLRDGEDEDNGTPEDVESLDASSLSGEMSRSGFEFEYVNDSDDDEKGSHVGSCRDDEIWQAFETALESHEIHGAQGIRSASSLPTEQQHPSHHNVPLFLEDDGYDGSASEVGSVSSLDDSHDDDMGDQFFYSGVRETQITEMYSPDERGHQSDAGVISSLCSGVSSRLSSIASTVSKAGDIAGTEIHDDSLSIDGEADASYRWIENIPVLRLDTIEQIHGDDGEAGFAKHWCCNKFVQANAGRQWQRAWSDEENLTLDVEDAHSLSDDSSFPALATLTPTRKLVSVQHHHLEAQESYVSFAELAGIIERHVTRRPGLFMDLGCGTSRFCEELVFRGYSRVLGIDSDLSAIAFQRQQSAALQLPEYLQFLPMDTTKTLLLPDQCCDLILSKATLDAMATRCLRVEFPHELVQTLTESIRCLKPGGIFMAVVYQENQLEEHGSDFQLDADATADERAAVRLETPWWKWTEVRILIDHDLTLVQQYELGRPRLIDGVRTKPYKALVWRRRETKRERLRGLVNNRMEAKRQQCEYDTRMWLYYAERERTREEAHIIRWSRQMIFEDERSRLERAFGSEAEAVRLRQQRREAFYAKLLEEDMQLMPAEDYASSQERIEEMGMKTFVVETVLHVLIIGRAVELAIARQDAVQPKTQQEADAVVFAETKTATSTKTASPDGWIREEIARIVDTAMSVRQEIPQSGPETKYQTDAPRVVQTEQTVGTPPEEREGHGIEATAKAVSDAVEWILSTAIASLRRGEIPSNSAIGINPKVSARHAEMSIATEAEANSPLSSAYLVLLVRTKVLN